MLNRNGKPPDVNNSSDLFPVMYEAVCLALSQLSFDKREYVVFI